MKQKNIFPNKKILVIGIIAMLICVGMAPIVSSNIVLRNIEEEKNLTAQGGTEYWAVIVAVAKYKNPDYTLPIPKERLKVLYYSLLEAKNWDKNHIILLINEDATRDNILDALDTMAKKVDFNDVFLFAFMGHGSAVPDEYPFDEKDGTDEVICPYDIYRDENGNLHNYITDDELNRKFTKIEGIVFKHTKGLLLIFESCLSGALVDKKWHLNIDGKTFIKQEGLDSFTSEFSEELKDPPEDSGATDIDGRKRFVIMASVDATLAVVFLGFGGPLTSSLAVGFAGYADGIGRFKKDNIISAEEAFKFTQRRYVKVITGYIGGCCTVLFLEEYFYARMAGKSHEEALKIAASAVAEFLVMTAAEFIYYELLAKISTGYWVLSFPNKVDKVPGELDIVELKDNRFTTDIVPDNWQPAKPITPEGRMIGQPGVSYAYVTFSVDPINDEDSNKAKLYYKWNWGDGSTSDWLGPYESESGTKITASHTWAEEGTYVIKVKVKDTNGVESEWSDPLSLKISKSRLVNRHPIQLLFQKFLEQYPQIFYILKHLVRL